jgi:uncharacterized membrane protein YccF (DUF307 family)
MRVIGNILWLIFVGWHTALAWLLFGAVLCITVVGIPFGVQCFKLARFSFLPFGRHVVRKPGVRVFGAFGNVIWFILAGVWLSIAYVIGGVILCITIIGIPFGIQAFKLTRVAILPFGKEVVRD